MGRAGVCSPGGLGRLLAASEGNCASAPSVQLEAQLLHLSRTQQEASSENQQLREAQQNLAGQLEEVQGQLQVARRHLGAARGRVSWQMEEEPRQVAVLGREGTQFSEPLGRTGRTHHLPPDAPPKPR